MGWVLIVFGLYLLKVSFFGGVGVRGALCMIATYDSEDVYE